MVWVASMSINLLCCPKTDKGMRSSSADRLYGVGGKQSPIPLSSSDSEEIPTPYAGALG